MQKNRRRMDQAEGNGNSWPYNTGCKTNVHFTMNVSFILRSLPSFLKNNQYGLLRICM